MSIENWPARREVREYTVTDATGWMQPWPLNLPAKMVPASDYKALEARLRDTAEALREMAARCGQCDGTGEAEDDTDPDPITGQVYPASCEFCEAARAVLAALEKEGLA